MALAEAFAAFQSGQHDKADALLKEVIRTNPRHLPAMVAWGMVASASGRRSVAIERMQDVLRIDRNCLPALQWMCRLSNESQMAPEAVQFGERALAVDPRNVETAQLLGDAYSAQRRYQDALAQYDKAIRANPQNAPLHYRKADVLEKMSQEPGAVDELKIALRLAPSHQGLLKLAYLQLHVGGVEDAIGTCTNAIEGRPDDPNAHVLMACALTEFGRLDDAESHWARAESLAPGLTWIGLERARSLSRLGRFDAAAKELTRVIEQDETVGSAYYSIVSVKRVTEDDRPLIERMERVLKDSNLGDPGRIHILYALGKSFDDLGDYGAAISHFDQANEMQRRLNPIPFDKAQYKSYVDQQIARFTREFVERRAQDGLDSELPLFVIGMMRSGTTLAEQILTCHSGIGGAGEQAFLTESSPWFLDWRSGLLSRDRTADVGNAYLARLQAIAPGFPRVVDKNPGNSMVAGQLHLVFPKARFIHMRRNPMDTVLSIWMTPMQTGAGFVGDRENIVFAYQQYMRLMDHWRSILPSPQFLEVEYESLVEDPGTATHKMTDFLGLEWEEACIHPETNKNPVRTPSLWQVRQPFFKTSTERWKRYAPWLGPFAKLK
jgi:tetratricopeptide (TPR) repeat protein